MFRDANYCFKGIKLLLWVIAPFLIYTIPPERFYEGDSLCLFTNIFGVHCYGCGITRAIFAAMHLDFREAFNYNHSIIVVLPLLIYTWTRGGYRLFKDYTESKKRKN